MTHTREGKVLFWCWVVLGIFFFSLTLYGCIADDPDFSLVVIAIVMWGAWFFVAKIWAQETRSPQMEYS